MAIVTCTHLSKGEVACKVSCCFLHVISADIVLVVNFVAIQL